MKLLDGLLKQIPVEARWVLMTQLLESVEMAERMAPGAWHVTAKISNLMLVVGNHRALTFRLRRKQNDENPEAVIRTDGMLQVRGHAHAVEIVENVNVDSLWVKLRVSDRAPAKFQQFITIMDEVSSSMRLLSEADGHVLADATDSEKNETVFLSDSICFGGTDRNLSPTPTPTMPWFFADWDMLPECFSAAALRRITAALELARPAHAQWITQILRGRSRSRARHAHFDHQGFIDALRASCAVLIDGNESLRGLKPSDQDFDALLVSGARIAGLPVRLSRYDAYPDFTLSEVSWPFSVFFPDQGTDDDPHSADDGNRDADPESVVFPEELVGDDVFVEGAVESVLINRYERSASARAACIAHHGASCLVCGFDFGSAYGAAGRGLIHVHHLRPLSTIGTAYQVDPVHDLIPVCANCHTMIHRVHPPYSVDDVRAMLSSPPAAAAR